jgi:transcriptional regulator with XRE-family HTH domain
MIEPVTCHLAEKLADRQMSRMDLANRLNVDPVTVFRYMKGTRVPSVHTAQRIARILRCSIASLWPEATPKSPAYGKPCPPEPADTVPSSP